jgi:hypothetical protein
VANYEASPDPYSDPTPDIIYDIIRTMQTEQVGGVAVNSEVDSTAKGARSEDIEVPPPLLPSTSNDVRWEAWHKGDVDIIAGPGEGSGEILKIYRDPKVRQTITLTTPSGNTTQIGAYDIIQVYKRDRNGKPLERPSLIFQGMRNLPKEYRVDEEQDEKQQAEVADMMSWLIEDLKDNPLPKPAFGRETPERPLLHNLSYYLSMTRKTRLFEVPTGNPHESLVIYSLLGTSMHVVTPMGFLLDGHSHDLVEIVHSGPDGGYTTQRSLPLYKLAQEKRYMIL